MQIKVGRQRARLFGSLSSPLYQKVAIRNSPFVHFLYSPVVVSILGNNSPKYPLLLDISLMSVLRRSKKEKTGGWGNSCYLINFATISLVVLLTIPYFLQKNNIRFNIYIYATATTPRSYSNSFPASTSMTSQVTRP